MSCSSAITALAPALSPSRIRYSRFLVRRYFRVLSSTVPLVASVHLSNLPILSFRLLRVSTRSDFLHQIGVIRLSFPRATPFCLSTEVTGASWALSPWVSDCPLLNIRGCGSHAGILRSASTGPDPARCCSSWSIRLIILSLGFVIFHPLCLLI